MTELCDLRCAAAISAADRLMVEQTVAMDEAFAGPRPLVAMMTYLNRHALERKLPEHEAMAAVQAKREELLASMTPAEVVAEARLCLASPSA